MQQFEFVPHDEQEPSQDGVDLTFEVADPNAAEARARYTAAFERNPFAEDDVFDAFDASLTDRAEDLIDPDELCTEATSLSVIVGYPFQGNYTVPLSASSPRGFTRAELFRQIVSVYSAMYAGAEYSPARLRLNTHVESPRFGVAWHRIEDLVLEGATIVQSGGRTLVWIWIGS